MSGFTEDDVSTTVLDLRADTAGAFFSLMRDAGDISHRVITHAIARLGGAPATVYEQGSTIPGGIGLYDDAAGQACALVSASDGTYTECLGASRVQTGLGAVSSGGTGFAPARIFAAEQGGGNVFFMESRVSAISAVVMNGADFQTEEIFESSISYPGGAVSVDGYGYACVITSASGVGVATSSRVSTRSHDSLTYDDCRIATDGGKLHVVGVTSTELRYAPAITPLDPLTGAAGPVSAVPLGGADPNSAFALVWFAGKPGLIQRTAGGAIAIRDVAADGTLGAERDLVSGTDDWGGLAVVGPDGGVHLVFTSGGGTRYAKRCP